MNILEKIENHGKMQGDNIVMEYGAEKLTYSELWEKSDRLAGWISERLGDSKKPVLVYGHKHPMMLVCFLACVKSGRAYCPVDISMPGQRIGDIAEAVDNDIILGTEENTHNLKGYVSLDEIDRISKEHTPVDYSKRVSSEDTYYIIFTSGSTGKPKGVEISLENLNNFTDWSVSLVEDSQEGCHDEMRDINSRKSQLTFMNQAPFSFDLSVMDLYTCLAMGGRLYSIDKKTQQDPKLLMDELRKGGINVWVSTPSFAEMTMANKEFNGEEFDSINTFLFCGEKLGADTGKRLQELFPNSCIYNTYGPTESTVAVTGIKLDDSLFGKGDLPIGRPKPGTEIYIFTEDGSIAKEGEKGEIVIAGNTVSKGYFKNREKTSEVFIEDNISSFHDSKDSDETKKAMMYKTGDEGYISNGLVYCTGRIDLQIKLHGYRIELGDIESNLTFIEGISQACVVPRRVDGKIRNLVAFVVEASDANAPGKTYDSSTAFQKRKEIRDKLKCQLPDYMVPKKIVFVDSLPMTINGKVDRKKLEAMV